MTGMVDQDDSSFPNGMSTTGFWSDTVTFTIAGQPANTLMISVK